jgi:hypothetical protein
MKQRGGREASELSVKRDWLAEAGREAVENMAAPNAPY